MSYPTDNRLSEADKITREVSQRCLAKKCAEPKEVKVKLLSSGNLMSRFVTQLWTRMNDNRQIQQLGLVPDLEELTNYCVDRLRDRVNHVNYKSGDAQFDARSTEVYIPAFIATWMKLVGRTENPNKTLVLSPEMDGTYALTREQAKHISYVLEQCMQFGFAAINAFPVNKDGSQEFMMLNVVQKNICALYDTPLDLTIPAAVFGPTPSFSKYGEEAYDIFLGSVDAIDTVIGELLS